MNYSSPGTWQTINGVALDGQTPIGATSIMPPIPLAIAAQPYSMTIAAGQRSDINGPITIPSGVTITIAAGAMLNILMDDYWRIG